MENWNEYQEMDDSLTVDWDVEIPQIENVGSAAPTTPSIGNSGSAAPTTPSTDNSGGTGSGKTDDSGATDSSVTGPGAQDSINPDAGQNTGSNAGSGTGGGSKGNSNSHASKPNKPITGGGDVMIELTGPEEKTQTVIEHNPEIVEVTILDNFRMPEAEAVTEVPADPPKEESGIPWVPIAALVGVLAIALLLKAAGLRRKKQHKTRGDTAK